MGSDTTTTPIEPGHGNPLLEERSLLSVPSPTDSTASTSMDLDLLESSTATLPEIPREQSTTEDDTRREYEVCLEKDMYGLGIYFVKDQDYAIVDQHVPFYKLPSGHAAPGEASGVIKPGDVLTHINEENITTYKFEDVVDTLRNLPLDNVTLRFRSPQFHALIDLETMKTEALEDRVRMLEQELAREKKCRCMAEKRMHMYRDEVLRLSELNVALRCELKKVETVLESTQKFSRLTHLSV
ncbi:unnamed protein product [Aphanomyces euteiches]|uniref:PDZ domain-containing protein n=1 Tax=Aphanomyces euteiches TaxID=100861 RepID=A0A6G0X918_9STRA|nr:hypothetical protein Ae201684_007551 [Aphanomyces euteiches]KAH9100859.1 hypothetical protein Ae201684P_007051 [Aphanomyces euteiches]KAH9141366.1 hypothetical protein AeRB84_014449 [Aphanomyces euteiches]